VIYLVSLNSKPLMTWMNSRQCFYGPVQAFRDRSHLLSELPTQFLLLQCRRITPPDEKMQHILEVAVPKLLQSVPTKQKKSLPHEKLIPVSTTVVFCNPGSCTRSPPAT
jgi:hypothetical protein